MGKMLSFSNFFDKFNPFFYQFTFIVVLDFYNHSLTSMLFSLIDF